MSEFSRKFKMIILFIILHIACFSCLFISVNDSNSYISLLFIIFYCSFILFLICYILILRSNSYINIQLNNSAFDNNPSKNNNSNDQNYNHIENKKSNNEIIQIETDNIHKKPNLQIKIVSDDEIYNRSSYQHVIQSCPNKFGLDNKTFRKTNNNTQKNNKKIKFDNIDENSNSINRPSTTKNSANNKIIFDIGILSTRIKSKLTSIKSLFINEQTNKKIKTEIPNRLKQNIQINNLASTYTLQENQLNHNHIQNSNTIKGPIELKDMKLNINNDFSFDLDNFCLKCYILAPLRSRHCETCNYCISGFDHHCSLLGICIGEKNKLKFILFLFFLNCEILITIIIFISQCENNDSLNMFLRINCIRLIPLVINTQLFVYVFTLLKFITSISLKNLTSAEYYSWHKINYMIKYNKNNNQIESPFTISKLTDSIMILIKRGRFIKKDQVYKDIIDWKYYLKKL